MGRGDVENQIQTVADRQIRKILLAGYRPVSVGAGNCLITYIYCNCCKYQYKMLFLHIVICE